jgi:hypothetical protein
MRSCWLAIMALLFFATGAAAQVPPPIILPIPNPNPSSSLVLPPPSQIPVWPVPRHGARGGQLYYLIRSAAFSAVGRVCLTTCHLSVKICG